MDARRIEDDYSRCLALVSLSATVPEAEREQDIVALLAEIQKVDYLLHIGELLLRLSTHAPAAAGLADSGLHAIQRVVQHNGFGVNIVLREIERFPQHKREAVFRQCWKWILSQTHKRHRYELFMAAKHAAEYWTATELDIVRGELSRMSPDQCVYELVNLLPVVIRLGANDLIDEAVNQISKQENPNDRLSHAIEAIKFLPTSDLRDLLRRSWLLALKSDAPRISSLIDGFELLNAEDQVNVWPKLTACAKAFPQAGLSLARLSLLAKSSLERTELLEAALSACANEKADHRIPAAAQIVLACKEPAEKLRAFDLLTSHPAVPRPTVLAAVERAAPGFAEIGGATLTRALMDDIRQSARWWP